MALDHSFNTGKIGYTAWKVLKYGVFSGPYFPGFGLNMEIYSLKLKLFRDVEEETNNFDPKKVQ